MSRTYKDRPARIRFPENYPFNINDAYEKYEYTYSYNWNGTNKEVIRFSYLPKKGAKRKQRRHQDHEWHWMSTPSEWTRIMMNRPQRREYHLLEHEAVKTPLDSLEELDIPDYKRKPHIYYY